MRQHPNRSYAKSALGDRCLLQTDGNRVIATGSSDRIGLRNGRLNSALRTLKDLALREDRDDGVTHLTEEGRCFLAQELATEVGP